MALQLMALASRRLLIIGGSGFVGARTLVAAARAGYHVSYTYARQPVNLPIEATPFQVAIPEAAEALEKCIAQVQPHTVIYAAVPSPQNASFELHQAVSIDGVRRTLGALAQVSPDALFVYISTNTVFGGGRGLYREDEVTDPTLRRDPYRAYALTKAEGEGLVRRLWPNSIIARTSVVDGRDVHGQLYPRLAGQVARLQAGQPLVRFADRYFSPTLIDNLVEALLEVLEPTFGYRGILHLAGNQRVTDYELALYLARQLELDEKLVQAEQMADSPTMANSPRDSSLDVSFTQSLLRTRLLNVPEQLKHIFL